MIEKLVTSLGTQILRRVTVFGSYLIFMRQALREVIRRPWRFDRIIYQLEYIGYRSSLIIVITGFSVGAVFGLQVGGIFQIFNVEGLTGGATGMALARELAPLITAFLVAGRVGSAITAELAAMKINEQIDAMEAMGVDPLSYLVKPRIIAATVVMPILCAFFVVIGLVGSYASTTLIFNVSRGIYEEKVLEFLMINDVWSGLVKAAVFGTIVSSIACRYGLKAKGGARGIGEATTNGVVANLLSVLTVDVIITYIQIAV